MSWRAALLAGVALLLVIAVGTMQPVPQDLNYYQLADRRSLFGIANFLNVASNLPFLAVGIMGLRQLAANHDITLPQTRAAWIVFYLGIGLTAFGSAYFHLDPNNDTLAWDRLPMTIAFMSLVAIVTAEYFSARAGKRMLLPLLLIGIASVVYWDFTESIGKGDLRPYAIVQFLPMLMIPMIIVLYRSRSLLGRYIWWMCGFYIAAKLAEFFDAEIYAAGELVSGHSLKHLLASLAPASLLYGLKIRYQRGR